MTISGRSCRRKNKSGKSYICNVAATVLAGYALSRQDLYGRKIFNWFIAIPMWFGVGLIPTYLTINSLGLVNKLKKKMVTKLFAGVLTMCMLAGTLSGCGSADQNPADSSVQSTEVSKSAEGSKASSGDGYDGEAGGEKRRIRGCHILCQEVLQEIWDDTRGVWEDTAAGETEHVVMYNFEIISIIVISNIVCKCLWEQLFIV